MTDKRRRRPNCSEKQAAALLTIKRGDDWLIPEPLRSKGSAAEICAYVEWDHLHAWALGGDNSPQNLKPHPKNSEEHKRKTHGVKHGFAGSDRHKVNKGKRLREKYAENPALRSAYAVAEEMVKDDWAPAAKPKKPKAKIPGRPMPGTKASGQRKRMNGGVEKW